MFDPIAQGLRAVSSGNAYAFPLVFASGALTSAGPCSAPRLIAIAGLASNRQRRAALVMVSSFVAGLIVTYASFAGAASVLGHVIEYSTWVYAGVAAALAAAAFAGLWKEGARCRHMHEDATRSSAGASFFLGASFALVVSPCCTPVVLGIVAYTSAAGSAVYGGALLACFAFGHALPLFAAACGARVIGSALQRHAVREAAGVLSAALMLALAAYYGVLA